MVAEDMKLPEHLVEEAQHLRDGAKKDNPVTEPQARPLIRSTVVWLMQNGTINKEDSPNVILKAGELLHSFIPLHLCQVPKGKHNATDFATRISTFLQNSVTRTNADFKLQVAHDAVLNTPMRALEEKSLLVRVEDGMEPLQGHSGKSIVGKRRARSESGPQPEFPINDDSEEGLVPPLKRPPVPPSVQTTSNGPPLSSEGLSTANMLRALAAHAGLDIRISPPGRSAETASLPPQVSVNSESPPAQEPSQEPPPAAQGPQQVPWGVRKGRGSTARGSSCGARGSTGGARGSTGGARGSTGGARGSTGASAGKAAKVKEPFKPLVPFEQSQCSPYEVSSEKSLEAGVDIAYYLALPEEKGGVNWYRGQVTRISKTWADVSFPDGKLWCSCKPAERGLRWVVFTG